MKRIITHEKRKSLFEESRKLKIENKKKENKEFENIKSGAQDNNNSLPEDILLIASKNIEFINIILYYKLFYI